MDGGDREDVDPAEELERAPVAFENPPPVRPFEPLASFVGLPRYGTLDPSPILALTFPLFVGLIKATYQNPTLLWHLPASFNGKGLGNLVMKFV